MGSKPAKKGRAAEKPPERPASLIEQIASAQDHAHFVAVMQNRAAGRESTQSQLRGAGRYEKARDLQRMLGWVSRVDRKWLNQWAGMQNKLLDDAALRYGVPIKGATWSVPELVHWLFRWLAKNGRFVLKAQVEGEAAEGETSEWLERLREEQARIKRIERLELERKLIPTDEVREVLELYGAALRGAAEQMKREDCQRGFEIYSEALDNCERLVARYYERWSEDGERESDGDAPGGAQGPPARPDQPLDG